MRTEWLARARRRARRAALHKPVAQAGGIMSIDAFQIAFRNKIARWLAEAAALLSEGDRRWHPWTHPRRSRTMTRRKRISTRSGRSRRSAMCRSRCTPGRSGASGTASPTSRSRSRWSTRRSSIRTRCWSSSWRRGSTTTASGPGSGSRSRPSTCTRRPITSPGRTRRGSSGRSATRCGAGRSATRWSSTATRTTATTSTATAATRCIRRASGSGATRRRTAASRSSPTCRASS